MKNKIKMAMLFFFAGVFTACNKEKGPEVNNTTVAGFGTGAGTAVIQTQINNLPLEELSDAEKNWILHMREEEKLARDVYRVLYEKWGAGIFTNISTGEQTHMDAVKMLITKYGLTDPVVSDNTGEFTDPELQQLFITLTQQGDAGILAAYRVGATIEDLDLNDLGDAIADVDNQDVILVFENLAKGSRNHLRSFCKNIIKAGGTYIPQYITLSEFEAIISSPMEKGGW